MSVPLDATPAAPALHPSPQPTVSLTVSGRVLLSASVGVGLLAWSHGAEGTSLLACLCLSLLALSRRAARRNLLGLGLSQALPPRARAGVPTTVEVTLVTHASRPSEGLVLVQERAAGASPAQGRAGVPRLEPAGTAVLTLPVTFRRRGEARLGRVVVSSEAPWGLLRAEAVVEAPAVVQVWPREGRPTRALHARLSMGQAAGARTAEAACAPDDLHGVRAWRDGDDPRRLHAASSLRRGEPMVADWRERRAGQVVLALGPCRDRASVVLLERSVSVLATAWSLCHREAWRCTLLVGGTAVSPGAGAYPLGLDLLSRTRARDTLSVDAGAARLRRAQPGLLVLVGGAEAGGALAGLQRTLGPRCEAWWLDTRTPAVQRCVEGLP